MDGWIQAGQQCVPQRRPRGAAHWVSKAMGVCQHVAPGLCSIIFNTLRPSRPPQPLMPHQSSHPCASSKGGDEASGRWEGSRRDLAIPSISAWFLLPPETSLLLGNRVLPIPCTAAALWRGDPHHQGCWAGKVLRVGVTQPAKGPTRGGEKSRLPFPAV